MIFKLIKVNVHKLLKTFNQPILFILLSIICLSNCSQQSTDSTIKVVIKKQDFIIKIPSIGELEAVKETTIAMPATVRTPQVLEWLIEENTYVTKGQVVARFDGRKFRHQSSQEQLNIDKANIGIKTKQTSLLNEKSEISTDALLINEELQISEKFSVDDLQVYSRNEIIDALKNQDYLIAKKTYTQWRGNSHEKKSDSEIQLLSLQKMQLHTKLKTFKDALQTMEILAPHDGLFVLKKNWRGEKPHAGDTLFPGMKVASLPNLSQLQAKVFILESESAGVKVNQRVELTLDAYPNNLILGEIIKIDAIAKTRSRSNPVKYFEAIIKINTTKETYWRPGSQLKATIYAAEKKQVISIPTQAMSENDGRYYVNVLNNNEWVQHEIKIGIRNTAQTEILKGLNVGDVISLFDHQLLGTTSAKGL